MHVRRVEATLGAGHALGPADVASAAPDRRGLSQSNRTDQGHRREEHADQSGDDLALEHADQRQGQVHQQRDDGGPPLPGAHRAGHEVDAADEQPADGQNAEHGVHRLAPVVGPVDVVQVQPQGKLVEGEADANPEERGRHVQCHPLGSGGDQGQPGAEHRDDAENLVVHVHPADAHVLERATRLLARADVPGDEPRAHERDEDGDEHRAHRTQRGHAGPRIRLVSSAASRRWACTSDGPHQVRWRPDTNAHSVAGK